MDAYNTFLTVFAELQLSMGFTFSPDIFNTPIPIWAQKTDEKVPAALFGFIDACDLISSLDEAHEAYVTYGDFTSTKNGKALLRPVLMVGDQLPVTSQSELITKTLGDVALICGLRRSGVGLVTRDHGFFFASHEFLKPLLDAVTEFVRDQAREKFYPEAYSFGLGAAYEGMIQTRLCENADFVRSLDIGALNVANDRILVLHINFRDDVDLTEEALSRVTEALSHFPEPYDGIVTVLHSVGERQHDNLCIARMYAAPRDIDFDNLLGR